MDKVAFIFTICFVLVGPIRLIPAYAKLTRGQEPAFRRRAATWGALLACVVCLIVAALGGNLIDKYDLSMPALKLTAGLVLLLSALRTIFPGGDASDVSGEATSPMQLAISPLATPTIVPASGVAAILIFVMIGRDYPAVHRVLAVSLGAVMALDFLVMYFNERILRVPGLLSALQLLGGVLIVVQVALGIDTMLSALRDLGVVTGV